jgi:hypothetical protein
VELFEECSGDEPVPSCTSGTAMALLSGVLQPPQPPQPAEAELPELRSPGIRRSTMTTAISMQPQVASHCQFIASRILQKLHKTGENTILAEAWVSE